MAFFLKLKNNRFMVYLLALVFSIAIFTPFYYTSANADSNLQFSSGNNTLVEWNNDNSELIAIKLPNGNITGYIDGNAFISGTTGASNAQFVFGFIPYEVTYAGETEQLNIEVLSSANFTFYLDLPNISIVNGVVSYDVNNYTTVPINVGWNPDNNTYTDGLFSSTDIASAWSRDGVTFSSMFYNGYMRFVITTGTYSGNYSYTGGYTQSVSDTYVSNVDYKSVVQVLSWLRTNHPTYFNNGAHVSSFHYTWNVFTQYSSSEGELKELENAIVTQIQQSNSNLQIEIENTINNSTNQIQGSINELENSVDNMANMGSGVFDDLGSDIDDIANGIGNSNNIIDSVEKPDVNDVSDIVDDVYNSLFAVDEAGRAFNNIMDLLVQQNFILSLILVSLVVGLIKYLFFGRGA